MPQSTQDRIRAKCQEIADFLAEKNASYGDSALRPLAVFGKGDPETLIRARIDDKLLRIKHAPDAFGEDALKDLIGYLILLTIVLEDKRATVTGPAARPGAM